MKNGFEIVWTPNAEKGFENIIAYLTENWSPREVKNFVQNSFRFFELLSDHPYILERSERYKNIYRGPMDKFNICN